MADQAEISQLFSEAVSTQADRVEVSQNYSEAVYSEHDDIRVSQVYVEIVYDKNPPSDMYTYNGSSYSNVSGKLGLMGLSPGLPPKCSFGDVHVQRPWLGGDPDNPGYVWFGNLTFLDFSTANGGGYIGAVDDAATSFAVAGLKSFYGDLYIFGAEDQPFLAKLTGSSPTDWALPAQYQKQATTNKTLISSINDLWFASSSGVDALSGVQEYGDLRTFSYSDPVGDRIRKYWSSASSIAGYNPNDGQYLLYMPGYHRVLCCHTKNPVAVRQGEIRYPWSEYEFTRDHLSDAFYFNWIKSSSGKNEYYVVSSNGGSPGIVAQPDFVSMDGVLLSEGSAGILEDHEYDYTDNDSLGYDTIYIRDDSGSPGVSGRNIRTIISPTCFCSFGGTFYVGSNAGYIYKLSNESYKDRNLYQIYYDLKTQYVQSKFSTINLTKQQVNIGGITGAALSLKIYTDDQFLIPTATYYYYPPLRDDLLIKDLNMPLIDAWFTIDPTALPLYQDMNVIARTFLFRITDLRLTQEPIFINGLSFMMRILEA